MSLRNLETPSEKEARRLVERTHEKELAHHLTKLEGEFADWRAGKITAVSLTERINAFHDGPARVLAKRYHPNDLLTALANAVTAGQVTDAEVPAELRDELAIVVSVLKLKR
jgi:hypothetical protein